MSRSIFLIPSAISVLAALPGLALAQSVQPPVAEVTMFVPLVEACVATPTPETCQQVRAVVTECASSFVAEGCSVLLSVPDQVFNDPAQTEIAQTALSAAAARIADMTFAEVDHSPVDEISRADAERTFLRGDENLMAHSAPPVLDGTVPPPETEPVTE